MYETITVLICIIFKYATSLNDRRSKDKFTKALKELKPYQAPPNQEAENLKAKKQEIQNTMEQFNNPSTFAKYSKMQRELIKLDRQIEEAIKKGEAEGDNTRQKYEEEQKAKKESIESEQNTFQRNQIIVRIVVNLVLLNLVRGYYSQPLLLAHSWPLSMFTNENAQINCGWILLACSILLNF